MKPGSEQSFLYGNHVLKSGLGRITENTAQYQGVVVYSMADVPLVSPAPPAARHGSRAAGTSLFSLFFASPGVWGSRQVDAGLPEGGPHGDRGVPPGRRGGVRAERRHADLGERGRSGAGSVSGQHGLVLPPAWQQCVAQPGAHPGQGVAAAPTRVRRHQSWCCGCIKPVPSPKCCCLVSLLSLDACPKQHSTAGGQAGTN